MPFPKRAKVAHSRSNSRVIEPTASSTQDSYHTAPQDSSPRSTSNSDDSQGLVTKDPRAGNRRGVAPQEATMSGALAVEDVAARSRPLRGRRRAMLSKIAREGDRAIEALRARKDAAERATKEHEKSTLDETVATSQQAPNMTAAPVAHTPKPASTSQIRAPIRRESSVLADFRRRPRQPSLLQMVHAQRNATRDEESRKDDDDDDSLNDFQPEDESTPFTKSKTQEKPQSTPSVSSSKPQQSPGSRKRKLGSVEPEVQVPASQPSPSQPSSPPTQTADVDPFDIPAGNDIPQPSLPFIRSTQLSSQPDESPLVLPENSNSAPQPIPKKRNTRSQALQKGRSQVPSKSKAHNKLDGQRNSSPPLSPLSSPSSHPSPVRSAQKPPIKPLATASLQNLLPRRRIRPADKEISAFDIPSSSDIEVGEDEDELSFHKPPKAKPKKMTATPKRKGGKLAPKHAHGRLSTTYGRKQVLHVSSDPEPSSETESSPARRDGREQPRRKAGDVYGQRSVAVKGEMRRLAQKFKEVDEWALEIEDVTPHSGSSQMVDAR